MTTDRGAAAAPPETADVVAAAVLAVPGVTALHAGGFGEVATYLPGRRVTGVRLGEQDVEVHVVLELGAPILDVAHRIRERVSEIVRRPVQVFVEDLAAAPAA